MALRADAKSLLPPGDMSVPRSKAGRLPGVKHRRPSNNNHFVRDKGCTAHSNQKSAGQQQHKICCRS
eukprot:1161944-Pelagomonas_calceolata.AAC.16